MTEPSLSVVVSTYEWPEALDAVLRGFADQADDAFELVVADDGSGAATAEVVDGWTRAFGDRLVHAWQEDAGFRLARVRNLGALATRGDYVVFVDGEGEVAEVDEEGRVSLCFILELNDLDLTLSLCEFCHKDVGFIVREIKV